MWGATVKHLNFSFAYSGLVLGTFGIFLLLVYKGPYIYIFFSGGLKACPVLRSVSMASQKEMLKSRLERKEGFSTYILSPKP